VGNSAYLKSFGVGIEFRVSGDLKCVTEGFKGLFARRYVPTFELVEGGLGSCRCSAVTDWLVTRSGFRLVSMSLSREVDRYLIESAPPAPYINESPYFFILQVLTRLYVKSGYLLLTDTVTVSNGDEAVLLMGYPHTGKSTLLALALTSGYVPLTTENTILEVRGGEARVVGGTEVLVYDPEIEGVYGVKVPYHDLTRHGYRIYDLRGLKEREEALLKRPRVVSMYLLYCSFNSRGCSYRVVKGRKATKTLWHFATSIIRGDDYYEPTPQYLSDEFTDSLISNSINELVREYSGRFYEVFGSHKDVLSNVLRVLG